MTSGRPAVYRVTITARAKQDMRSLVQWIAQHDSPHAAQHVLDRVLATCQTLATQPERGAYPAELVVLGVRRYRQVFFKPYRIFYRVVADEVAILLVADGRRDLKTLLERRLLGR